MKKIQVAPWARIVPWLSNDGLLVGVVYHFADGRLYICEVLNGTFVLHLNGRERKFPDRTTMTKWVKTHLV